MAKKILIVDYDKASLESFTELFKSNNFDVVTAVDGQDAYDKFKSEKPNAIILEAMLPKIHGFDLTQKVTKESKGSVPVIIVTSLYKGQQYRNEALRTFGASGYFEKPVDEDKLLKTVLSFLKEEASVEDDEDDLPDPDTVIELIAGVNDEDPSSGEGEPS